MSLLNLGELAHPPFPISQICPGHGSCSCSSWLVLGDRDGLGGKNLDLVLQKLFHVFWSDWRSLETRIKADLCFRTFWGYGNFSSSSVENSERQIPPLASWSKGQQAEQVVVKKHGEEEQSLSRKFLEE